MGFLQRTGTVALVIVVIYALVKDPHGGAHAAHAISGFFSQAAVAVSSFMNAL
jgi:hypothetical protein